MRYYNNYQAYNENDKTALSVIPRFNESVLTRTLLDCYKTCSRVKQNAYYDCKHLQYELQGYDFRIIGYNSMTFSCGFMFDDPFTGVVRFCYMTKDYTRFCDYIY